MPCSLFLWYLCSSVPLLYPYLKLNRAFSKLKNMLSCFSQKETLKYLLL